MRANARGGEWTVLRPSFTASSATGEGAGAESGPDEKTNELRFRLRRGRIHAPRFASGHGMKTRTNRDAPRIPQGRFVNRPCNRNARISDARKWRLRNHEGQPQGGCPAGAGRTSAREAPPRRSPAGKHPIRAIARAALPLSPGCNFRARRLGCSAFARDLPIAPDGQGLTA